MGFKTSSFLLVVLVAVVSVNCAPNGCNERLTGSKGSGYRGCQTVTRSGRTCQKWNLNSPHKHKFHSQGDHNYCRNPDGEKTIWCYTTDKGDRWDYCDPIDPAKVRQRTICEGGRATIHCPTGTAIHVLEGFYGRTNHGTCWAMNIWDWSCSAAYATPKIYEMCQGKGSCSISANNSFFGGDPCSHTHKYASVKYQCH